MSSDSELNSLYRDALLKRLNNLISPSSPSSYARVVGQSVMWEGSFVDGVGSHQPSSGEDVSSFFLSRERTSFDNSETSVDSENSLVEALNTPSIQSSVAPQVSPTEIESAKSHNNCSEPVTDPPRFTLICGHSLSGRTTLALESIGSENWHKVWFLAAPGEFGASWLKAFSARVCYMMEKFSWYKVESDGLQQMQEELRKALSIHKSLWCYGLKRTGNHNDGAQKFVGELFDLSEQRCCTDYHERIEQSTETDLEPSLSDAILVLDRLDLIADAMGMPCFQLFMRALNDLCENFESLRVVGTTNGVFVSQLAQISWTTILGSVSYLQKEVDMCCELASSWDIETIHKDVARVLHHVPYLALFGASMKLKNAPRNESGSSQPSTTQDSHVVEGSPGVTMSANEEASLDQVAALIRKRFDVEKRVLRHADLRTCKSTGRCEDVASSYLHACVNHVRLCYMGMKLPFVLRANELRYQFCGVVVHKKQTYLRDTLFGYALAASTLKETFLPVILPAWRGDALEVGLLSMVDDFIKILNEIISCNESVFPAKFVGTWKLKQSRAQFFAKSVSNKNETVPKEYKEPATDDEKQVVSCVSKDIQARMKLLQKGTVAILFPSDQDGSDLVLALEADVENQEKKYLIANIQCKSRMSKSHGMSSLRYPFWVKREDLQDVEVFEEVHVESKEPMKYPEDGRSDSQNQALADARKKLNWRYQMPDVVGVLNIVFDYLRNDVTGFKNMPKTVFKSGSGEPSTYTPEKFLNDPRTRFYAACELALSRKAFSDKNKKGMLQALEYWGQLSNQKASPASLSWNSRIRVGAMCDAIYDTAIAEDERSSWQVPKSGLQYKPCVILELTPLDFNGKTREAKVRFTDPVSEQLISTGEGDCEIFPVNFKSPVDVMHHHELGLGELLDVTVDPEQNISCLAEIVGVSPYYICVKYSSRGRDKRQWVHILQEKHRLQKMEHCEQAGLNLNGRGLIENDSPSQVIPSRKKRTKKSKSEAYQLQALYAQVDNDDNSEVEIEDKAKKSKQATGRRLFSGVSASGHASNSTPSPPRGDLSNDNGDGKGQTKGDKDGKKVEVEKSEQNTALLSGLSANGHANNSTPSLPHDGSLNDNDDGKGQKEKEGDGKKVKVDKSKQDTALLSGVSTSSDGSESLPSPSHDDSLPSPLYDDSLPSPPQDTASLSGVSRSGGQGGSRRDANNRDLIGTFTFSDLTRLSTRIPTSTTLRTCGELWQYDNSLDSITTNTKRDIEPLSDTTFVYPGMLDDPVMQSLIQSNTGRIYATDEALAYLMTAPISNKQWELIFTRTERGLLIDKHADAKLEVLTVNENSTHTLSNYAQTVLSKESMDVNQAMLMQSLRRGNPNNVTKHAESNPFHKKEAPPSQPISYRYKSFTLSSGVKMIVRTQIHALQKGKKERYMNLYTLTEHRPHPYRKAWSVKISHRRGKVWNKEIKNNVAKLGRWTAHSLLSGADLMKFAYTARISPECSDNHVLLGMSTYATHVFAKKIKLCEEKMWGIVETVCESLLNQGIGTYYMVHNAKDPQLCLETGTMDCSGLQ